MISLVGRIGHSPVSAAGINTGAAMCLAVVAWGSGMSGRVTKGWECAERQLVLDNVLIVPAYVERVNNVNALPRKLFLKFRQIHF